MVFTHSIIALMLAFAPAGPGLDGSTMPPGPDPIPARRTVIAQRASQPPVIDGRDDDAVWRTAERVSDFVQYDPVEGAEPSFRTEFLVSYDERNLYVFVRAYDPHPDSIMRALTRRDVRGPSDQMNRTGFIGDLVIREAPAWASRLLRANRPPRTRPVAASRWARVAGGD